MTNTSGLGTQNQARTYLQVTAETVEKTADYDIVLADRGKLFRFSGAGPWTAQIMTVAIVSTQFMCFIRNDSALDLTIETQSGSINGAPTLTLEPGLMVAVFCDGTNVLSGGVNLNCVPLIGGTMTGALILSGDPVTALGAATKQYVDAAGSGIAVQPLCYAATTANLNATQAGAGAGATLTNAGAMAAFSVDGVSPAINSRILVKNQTAPEENGCYTLTTVGSGAVNWVLTRATDYDTAAEIQPGTLFMITNGNVNAVTSWVETNVVVTVDTDPIEFAQFTFSPGSYANTALSNLAATAINTNLLPDVDDTVNIGSEALRYSELFTGQILTGETNGDATFLAAYDTGGAAYSPVLGMTAGNPPTATVASFVTGTTQAVNDNSTKLATTAFVTAQIADDAATRSLNNLSGVAVNTTLVSDTDVTDDLGTQAIRWRNIYANTLQTGDTAADVLNIGAWDVDGAAFTPFITLTANNTPSCVLASGVTATTQAPNDNSTKLATTAYADNVGAGSGSWIHLATASAAASATIDFTAAIDATYDTYVVKVNYLLPATNATTLWLRLRSGGVFRNSASDYGWATVSLGGNGSSNGDSEIEATLSGYLSNTSTKGLSGLFYLSDPSSTVAHKLVYGNGSFSATGATIGYNLSMGGVLIGVTTAVDGIRFMMNSGNITSGKFDLYGIKN